ncbi:MAG: amidohydrolase [Kouleothrix sp.]|nr:amidohydrolase [Kouleothrix sp.]
MHPDMIMTGGLIHTQAPGQPPASALAIAGELIVAVGDDATIAALAGPTTRRLDLAGATVIPGFNDAHIHLWKEGMLLSQVNARPARAASIPAIVAAFAARAGATPAGQWIEGRGYDETRLPELRHPDRTDLDRASAEHPIVLGRTCGHIIAVNTRALQLAGITATTPDPPGGAIDRDAHGQPTGVLRETAMALVRSIQPPPSQGELAQALIGAGRNCLALGITAIGEPGVDPRTVAVYRELDAAGQLPLRCDVMAMTILPNGQRVPPPSPWRGHMAKCDTVKLFSDGGLSSGTAALSMPYRNRHDCGLPRFPAEQLAEEVQQIYRAGLAVAVHSIGDRVIGELLDAFALCRSAADHPRTQAAPARLRIEHCGLPNSQQLARAHALGVMVATQPSFLYDIGETILFHLPGELVPQCYPFRAMFEAGLAVAFSSDGPVISDINPLLGLRSAVLRQTRAGRVIAAEQAIDVAQALWAFTAGSALVSGMAEQIGRIAPGLQADLAVLSGDPLALPIERLLEIQVQQTWVAGRLAYTA